MAFCPNCGSNVGNEQFCGNCGSPVSQSEYQSGNMNGGYNANQQYYQQTDDGFDAYQKSKPKSKRSLKLIGIIAAVLVVAIVAVTVGIALGGKPDIYKAVMSVPDTVIDFKSCDFDAQIKEKSADKPMLEYIGNIVRGTTLEDSNGNVTMKASYFEQKYELADGEITVSNGTDKTSESLEEILKYYLKEYDMDISDIRVDKEGMKNNVELIVRNVLAEEFDCDAADLDFVTYDSLYKTLGDFLSDEDLTKGAAEVKDITKEDGVKIYSIRIKTEKLAHSLADFLPNTELYNKLLEVCEDQQYVEDFIDDLSDFESSASFDLKIGTKSGKFVYGELDLGDGVVTVNINNLK